MFIDMLNTIQWIINCTSWHDKKLYQFDSIEIKSRLKHITRWLNIKDENQ
ncbi:MAG: hypothetical protein ACFFG0_00415 [Candidatus Thorarchaeota archaeon]